MTHRSTWKKQELKTAKLLGGIRSPNSGNALPDRTDVQGVKIKGKEITVSCKYQTKMLVATLFEEVQKNAKKLGRMPLLLLKTKYMRGQLVVMKLDDFLDLVGKDDSSKVLLTATDGLVTTKTEADDEKEM